MSVDQTVAEHECWFSPLGAAGPAPNGAPLVLEVECRTARRGRGTRHSITIEHDWTVTTPHELEVERIGQALGGYLTCFDLVDTVVPAVRQMVQLQTRRRLPGLALIRHGRWRLREPVPRCDCAAPTFAGLATAASHERGFGHWARRTPKATEPLMVAVVEAVTGAYGGFDHPSQGALDEVRSLVREPWGPAELWQGGIPPEFVHEVHRVVSPSGGPLPMRLYQAAAFARPSHGWLAELLATTRDPEVVAWAAWMHTNLDLDPSKPGGLMQWLELGLPRLDVLSLISAGCCVSDATDIAARSRLSVRGAAMKLAAWYRAGCQPGPGDLVALDRVGAIEWFTPHRAAIDWLDRQSTRLLPRPTRTQIALVLAVAGTTTETTRLLAHGARDALAAAAAVSP